MRVQYSRLQQNARLILNIEGSGLGIQSFWEGMKGGSFNFTSTFEEDYGTLLKPPLSFRIQRSFIQAWIQCISNFLSGFLGEIFNFGKGFRNTMLTEEILLTSCYGKYPIINRVLQYTSQVVVWDFWTINSMFQMHILGNRFGNSVTSDSASGLLGASCLGRRGPWGWWFRMRWWRNDPKCQSNGIPATWESKKT